MTLKCPTCHGVYTPILPDGLLYFHACSPLVDEKTGVSSPRPGARDENVDPAKAAAVAPAALLAGEAALVAAGVPADQARALARVRAVAKAPGAAPTVVA